MPTDKKRLNIILPEDIEMWLIKRAAFDRRSLAGTIVSVLSKQMNQDKRLAETLIPPRLGGVEQDRTPVYEIRPASPAEAPRKVGQKPDQEGR